jgi:hypothetical protein
MPRFHFNIRDGAAFIPDEEGMALPDIETAREEARDSARDFVTEKFKRRIDIDGQVIEITDDRGRIIETMKVRDVLN